MGVRIDSRLDATIIGRRRCACPVERPPRDSADLTERLSRSDKVTERQRTSEKEDLGRLSRRARRSTT